MRLSKAIIISAIAGLAIPALHFLFYKIELPSRMDHIWLTYVAVPLWPSSVFLIATAGMSTQDSLPIIAASFGVNVVLYCLIGLMIWLGWARRLIVFKIAACIVVAAWPATYFGWLF